MLENAFCCCFCFRAIMIHYKRKHSHPISIISLHFPGLTVFYARLEHHKQHIKLHIKNDPFELLAAVEHGTEQIYY